MLFGQQHSGAHRAFVHFDLEFCLFQLFLLFFSNALQVGGNLACYVALSTCVERLAILGGSGATAAQVCLLHVALNLMQHAHVLMDVKLGILLQALLCLLLQFVTDQVQRSVCKRFLGNTWRHSQELLHFERNFGSLDLLDLLLFERQFFVDLHYAF